MTFIRSKPFDMFFIISVGAWSTLLAYILEYFLDVKSFSAIYWLILVLGVDVSHVYSSMYRTYLSTEGRKEYGKLLYIIPLICFVVSFGLAYIEPNYFWRFLAYVAIFHFIRQQVGFVRIYNGARSRVDEWMIYIVTFMPVLIWHLRPNKFFNWFVKDEFFSWGLLSEQQATEAVFYLKILTSICIAAYILWSLIKKRNSSVMLLVLCTFVAWYFGIVVTESDFVFTMSNVLTHGLAYLALVWHTQKKRRALIRSVRNFSVYLTCGRFY